MKGTLQDKAPIELIQHIGYIDRDGEHHFELLAANAYSPIIRNMATSQQWRISWEQLLKLAIEEGLKE